MREGEPGQRGSELVDEPGEGLLVACAQRSDEALVVLAGGGQASSRTETTRPLRAELNSTVPALVAKMV